MQRYFVRVYDTAGLDYVYYPAYPVWGFAPDEANWGWFEKEEVEGNPDNILADDYDWNLVSTPKNPSPSP